MKKLLATLTTVAMLATTTAFAAPVANDAGYNKTAGTYSVAADLSTVEGQLTLLIIPESAYLDGNIEDADILYIDQGAYAEGLFQSVGILGGTTLGNGTYYAKIGGKNLTDGIIVEKFTIAAGEPVQIGNTNGDSVVDISDIAPIIEHIAGNLLTGKNLFAANTNGDAVVDISDIAPIIEHIAGNPLGTGTYVAQ